jgi:hypothetical protein
MPRKKVTQLRKLCGVLAGHSRQHAERAAAAATELVRPWLPEGVSVVDMLTFHLALGGRLQHEATGVTAIDDHHMFELQFDRNVRQDRDRAAADLREKLLKLKDGLNGVFGPGGAYKIFTEAGPLPYDPVALHQLGGRVRANLANDEFPMPAPLQGGLSLDREQAVADLEEPYQRLDEALVKLHSSESESKLSQATKDSSVAGVDTFGNKVARYYEAFFALIGLDGLAERVRRSSHRAANSEAEPGADDGNGGDPVELGAALPQARPRALLETAEPAETGDTPAADAPAAGAPAASG